MRVPAALIAVTFLGSALLVHAQERKESGGPAVYKVEFDIRTGSGGLSQHFSMLLDESRKGIFQAVNHVPVDAASPNYVDVGASIECTVRQSDGKAGLSGSIELVPLPT